MQDAMKEAIQLKPYERHHRAGTPEAFLNTPKLRVPKSYAVTVLLRPHDLAPRERVILVSAVNVREARAKVASTMGLSIIRFVKCKELDTSIQHAGANN